MNEDLVIIIQGPVRLEPSFMEKQWEGFNLIWSTWDYEKIKTNFPVIYNTPPYNSGVMNICYQQKSTLSGIIKAKELGYTKCLKWRSDQYPNNSNELIKLFDKDKTNSLYWHNHEHGYYVDYFMYGSVNDMMLIWDFNCNDSSISYPEQVITSQIMKHNLQINCMGDKLTTENNIIWEKNNNSIKLSSYQNDNLFIIKK
jgi:hypothetical protein